MSKYEKNEQRENDGCWK